jgi:plasmid stabilization system protein ParE
MTYRVQPTAQAEADIDRIFAWLSERSPDGARRWYEAFLDGVQRLESSPISFALAPEDDEFDEDLRQLLFRTRRGRTYRALFVVRGDVVHILCVRGPGERPIKPEDIET